jgi:hypothetical protein
MTPVIRVSLPDRSDVYRRADAGLLCHLRLSIHGWSIESGLLLARVSYGCEAEGSEAAAGAWRHRRAGDFGHGW